MAATNFNYQVALKEGLKSLQQGRLRQAEQSFKYLVDKFPGAEGGYRGLAKVHFEQEDRAGALRVLRDGAAALTRSGERSAAIGLLREAVTLDARDLATHRRLAAALALAGDGEAAVQEYARFIRDLRDAGDLDRAKLEAGYALGQLKGTPGLAALGEIANGEGARQDRIDGPRDETARATFGATAAPRPKQADPWETVAPPPNDAQLWSRPSPARSTTESGAVAPGNDPWSAGAPSPTRLPTWQTPAPTTAPTHPSPAASEPVAEPEPTAEEPAPAEPITSESQADTSNDAEVEAAAARYLATRDPRAAQPALEAARRYLRDGRTDAASDLLLQLIASGVADHDAQRLLVEVARTLGKREVARAKCQLLVQALLLDGRNDLAAEVEALAQAE